MTNDKDGAALLREGAKFEREERYIVIKRKYLNNGQEADIRSLLADKGIRTVECVVVENDWPEKDAKIHWSQVCDALSAAIRALPIPEAPASVEPVAGVSYAVYESAVKGRQDFRAAYKAQRDLLSAKEWQVVEQIGRDAELSISAVLRQSVRLYQLHCDRLKAGETFSWSGDEQRLKDFAGPLYARPEPDTIGNEIAKILQDDPICGGRVSSEAIGRISNMLARRDIPMTPIRNQKDHGHE